MLPEVMDVVGVNRKIINLESPATNLMSKDDCPDLDRWSRELRCQRGCEPTSVDNFFLHDLLNPDRAGLHKTAFGGPSVTPIIRV